MEELHRCGSCGYVASQPGRCPKCGWRLRTAKQVRLLGWSQLALGLFLIGMMGTITYYLAPTMLQPGVPIDGERFTGTAEQGLHALGLFGAVCLFGLDAMSLGLWQIITGRAGKWTFSVVVALLVPVFLSGWLVHRAFGG